MGMRIPGAGPPMVFQRDLALCLPFLMKNATIMCQGIYEGQKAELEILDTIIQFFHRTYEDSRADRMKGLNQLRHLFEYIETKGAMGTELLATFSTLFMTSIFTYIYGSKQMAIASPDSLDTEECYDFQQVTSMLSLMGKETANSFIDEVKSCGALPTGYDLNPLKKSVDNYLIDIQKNQEERYAANTTDSDKEAPAES